MAETELCILSTRVVRPSSANQGRRIDLTPWDLRLLAIDYIQKGLLLPKPHRESSSSAVSRLISSLSVALDHFFPLAGRLSTVKHGSSLSIHIDCNNRGAEFIHAAAPDVTASDILTPVYTPRVLGSFFPLKGAVGLDGHSLPLIAVQVTELGDGIFIGCSLNHVVSDAQALWHFINSWAEISRTGDHTMTDPPIIDRWFPEWHPPPPIRLPFSDLDEIERANTCTRPVRPLEECTFTFSARSIAELKARANSEMGSDKISSLQALLAHVWRSVTRARKLEPHQETRYTLAIGVRSRLDPPLPETYMGNAVISETVQATAGEVVGRSLGWVAWKLNEAVAVQTDGRCREWLKSWTEDPSFPTLGGSSQDVNLFTGGSPRFDVYGNDFGWGRPVAVRSGWTRKLPGKVTVDQGTEKGSVALEVCLSQEALALLLKDKDFLYV